MKSRNRIAGSQVFTVAITLMLAALGLSGQAAAQQCTKESVAQQRGKWVESRPDLVMASEVISPDRHPAILKRIEPIAAMFREAYPEPRGTMAGGQASIRRVGDEIKGGPVQYGYTSSYNTWLCPSTTRRAEIAGETGNWAYVYVNSLHRLLSEFGEMQIGGRPTKVWMLARRIGNLRGETLYELRYGRGLVFTRNGRYPWKPVSQKQYLDALALYYGKEADANRNDMDQLVRDMEKGIAEAKQNLTGETRDKVVAEMERAVAEVRARRPRDRDRLAHGVAQELKYIQDYQARHSAKEMAQPAILPGGVGGPGFRGKFAQESEGGRMLVVVDQGYFRKDLPQEAAQLVTLLWQWENDSPASAAWRASFERRFPIDRLRTMIDR